MSTQRDVAVDIRSAIDKIETVGWIQKTFGGAKRGGYCIVGALNAGCEDSLTYTATAEFGRWLRSLMGWGDEIGPVAAIARFNDAPLRTKEDVLLYMNKFADELDPRNPEKLVDEFSSQDLPG